MAVCMALFHGILTGCVSLGPTKPNVPYQGAYPPSLDVIAKRNPLLAREIGKLPELQDGIQETENSALQILSEFYENGPVAFDTAFKEMYAIGLPEHRKYCSPLQALFWLAEDGLLKRNVNILAGYSLNKLLDKAWTYYAIVFSTHGKLMEIIDGIHNESERRLYLEDFKGGNYAQMQRFIFMDYRRNREMFSKQTQRTIKKAINLSKKNPRWGNFTIVTERLNAPELIDYYEKERFTYVDWRTLPAPSVSPHYVFTHNKGECVSITGFTIHCLRKAGYKAEEIRVRDTSGQYPFHAVCLFEQNGKRYVMDNGRRAKIGIVSYANSYYSR